MLGVSFRLRWIKWDPLSAEPAARSLFKTQVSKSSAQFLKAPQRLARLMNSLSIAPSTCQKAAV